MIETGWIAKSHAEAQKMPDAKPDLLMVSYNPAIRQKLKFKYRQFKNEKWAPPLSQPEPGCMFENSFQQSRHTFYTYFSLFANFV